MQPFSYDIFSQSLIKTAPFKIFNIGTFDSEPIITVFGSGNITLKVNGQNVYLTGITDRITLDSEMQNAYRGTASMNSRMSGEFPVLSVGQNDITWSGNVTKLEIQPNWRWV